MPGGRVVDFQRTRLAKGPVAIVGCAAGLKILHPDDWQRSAYGKASIVRLLGNEDDGHVYWIVALGARDLLSLVETLPGRAGKSSALAFTLRVPQNLTEFIRGGSHFSQTEMVELWWIPEELDLPKWEAPSETILEPAAFGTVQVHYHGWPGDHQGEARASYREAIEREQGECRRIAAEIGVNVPVALGGPRPTLAANLSIEADIAVALLDDGRGPVLPLWSIVEDLRADIPGGPHPNVPDAEQILEGLWRLNARGWLDLVGPNYRLTVAGRRAMYDIRGPIANVAASQRLRDWFSNHNPTAQDRPSPWPAERWERVRAGVIESKS